MGLISVIVGVSMGVCGVGAVVIARHRAQAAADLSALAAAGSVAGGRDVACAKAGQLATRMKAVLAQCRFDGLDVIVTADMPVALQIPGFAKVVTVRSSARAGPAG